MNYFWDNLFEYGNDRRFGTVFFSTLLSLLLMVLGVAILYQIICAYDLEDRLIFVWPGLVMLLVVWIWRKIRRWRTQMRSQYKSSPLSRDELTKARSKLKTTPTFK